MGVDEVVKSIYVSLLVPKGSFELDRELGSNLFVLSVDNWETFCFEFERIFKEVLLDFDDVALLSFSFENGKSQKKIVARVLIDGTEERELEFSFKGKM